MGDDSPRNPFDILDEHDAGGARSDAATVASGKMDTQTKATQIVVALDADHDFDLTDALRNSNCSSPPPDSPALHVQEEAIPLFARIRKVDEATIDEEDEELCDFVDAEPLGRVDMLMKLMSPDDIDRYYCEVIEGAEWMDAVHEAAVEASSEAVAAVHEAAIEKPCPDTGLMLKDKVTQIVIHLDTDKDFMLSEQEAKAREGGRETGRDTESERERDARQGV